jgi:hypothetical protein
MLEWYDLWCTGQWIPMPSTGFIGSGLSGPAAGWMMVTSDGTNFRVANLTNVAYGATVSAAGSGYAQATTTVTASAGNSSWMPVIGGSIASYTVVAGGAGYSMPPLVFVQRPPNPGVPATAYATLTSGAVSAITVGTAGAGYLSAPAVMILPNPNDPNFLNGSITSQATATATLGGSGTLTAVLLTNFGQNVGTAGTGITLTVAGAGSSATAATVPAGGSWTAAANGTVMLVPAS